MRKLKTTQKERFWKKKKRLFLDIEFGEKSERSYKYL